MHVGNGQLINFHYTRTPQMETKNYKIYVLKKALDKCTFFICVFLLCCIDKMSSENILTIT